jgi:hypothetical protein
MEIARLRPPQGVGKVLPAFSGSSAERGAAMIHEHNGVQIDVPPDIERRIRRGDWKLLLALLGFVVLAVLSAIGFDDILIAAGVTNGTVAFIVPVAKLAALAGLTGFFVAGLNRRHHREQALLDFHQRTGRWPD